jgi:hypothetical protein
MSLQMNEKFISNRQLSTERLIKLGIDSRWACLNDKLGFENFILVWSSLKTNLIHRTISIPNYSHFKPSLLQAFIEKLEQEQYSDNQISVEIRRIFGNE